MREEIVGQKHIATSSEDRLARPEVWRLAQQARMSTLRLGRQQHVLATLTEELLVLEVRTGPDPKVPSTGLGLVPEVDGGEQRERVWIGWPAMP